MKDIFRIMLITQNEPFYLNNAIDYLLKILPEETEIVATVLLSPSPFGKKLTKIQKVKRTFSIFGLSFTLYYSIKFIVSKLLKKSVKQTLVDNHIPIIELKSSINSKESLKEISSWNPDLLVSIAGNEIFKKEIINLSPMGCINLHSALLPQYRGLMPSFWVLKNKEEFAGVSVFYVDEGIDSGPIIVQKKISTSNLSLDKLIIKTKKIGMESIVESIQKIINNTVTLTDNNDQEASYFSFPTKEDVNDFYKSGGKFF